MPRQIRGHPSSGPPIIQEVTQSTPHVTRRTEPVQQQHHRPAVAALLDAQPLAHRPTWGAPTWPPTPPDPRTRPGKAVARLDVDPAWLIGRRGGPRHGPPHPPTLGRAPAKPWRASGLIQDVSSRHHHHPLVAAAGAGPLEDARGEAGVALGEPPGGAGVPMRPEDLRIK